MKKIIIISIGVVCVALIGLAIAGGPMGGGWHRSPEEKIAYVKSELADKLELSDEQMLTLDRITEEILAEHEQVSKTHETFKASFLDLIRQESVAPDELKALFETKQPSIENWMQLAAENIAEFHSVLTPEQRATLIAEIESHKGRRCGFGR